MSARSRRLTLLDAVLSRANSLARTDAATQAPPLALAGLGGAAAIELLVDSGVVILDDHGRLHRVPCACERAAADADLYRLL